MTTLYSSVIKLHALHAGQLTHDPGQWANAAFYGILHQVDSQMAEMLHGLNGRKPFTVSSLNGLPRNVGPFVALRSGWECWLHITTLGDQIFQPFIRHFLQEGARPQIQLGPIQFTVAEALTTPGSHPWAGFSSDEALLSEAEMAERLTLEFASPTAFNLGSQAGSHASYALFPTPVLVFESLAYKWREFAQPAIDLDFITDAASDVRVTEPDCGVGEKAFRYWRAALVPEAPSPCKQKR